MSSKEKRPAQLLQGTLDLILLRTLASMGPQHAYQIAGRLQQLSGQSLELNQGTLYPALLRLEQNGYIESEWGASENNRKARFYSLTRAGKKRLAQETQDWERFAGIMTRLLNATE